MSEALRDLVVSLSLQTDNFTRNIRSVNKQIQEAESKFRLAAAGIEGFEKTESGYRYVGQGLPTENDEAIDLTFTLEGDDTPLHQPAGDFATAFWEGFVQFLQVAFIVVLFMTLLSPVLVLVSVSFSSTGISKSVIISPIKQKLP